MNRKKSQNVRRDGRQRQPKLRSAKKYVKKVKKCEKVEMFEKSKNV